MADVLRKSVVLAFIFLLSIFSKDVMAASFDCSSAKSDVELAICAIPELSALDELIAEEYSQLDRSGRYFEASKKNQLSWIKSNERLSDGLSFEVQYGFLKFINAFTKCLFNDDGTTNFFDACEADMRAVELNNCKMDKPSTLGMTICLRSYIKALTTIEDVETELSGASNLRVWRTYRESECSFVEERYHGGSMASLAFSECWVSLTGQRVRWIFNENH